MSESFAESVINAFTVWEFADRAALDTALANSVAETLDGAVKDRGAGTLVLSGGSTPRGFFRRLQPQSLNWESLTVTLADDRWVPPTHEDSNELLVRENLLREHASAAQFLPLVTDDPHPSAAVAAVSARLAPLGTLDVVILGMGGDGHFASLFPGSDALAAGLDLSNAASCIAVDPPDAPHARMSMTLRRILDARRVILHIVGDDKRAVLERAVSDANSSVVPIAALPAVEPRVEVYWAP